MVEHLTRNEKVVGSIPTISSKRLRISKTIRNLLYFLRHFFVCICSNRIAGNFVEGFSPRPQNGQDHKTTHTGFWSKKRRTAPDESSGAAHGFSASGSHHLGHEGSHLLGGVVLSLPGGVGIGAEGESRVVVAQHGGHRFHIYPILKSHGSKGMPISTPCPPVDNVFVTV